MEGVMLSIRLDKSLEKSLETVAKAVNLTKTAFVRKAIEEFIVDKMDYLSAAYEMRQNQSTHSLDDILSEFKDDLRD